MRSPLQTLRHALTIAWKDLTEYKRNRIALLFSMLFPLLMMGMFGFIFQDSASSLTQVPVGLVRQDSGPYGTQIVDLFQSLATNSGAIHLVDVASTTQAHEQILSAAIKAAVIIPETFSSSLQMQTPAAVFIITDPSNPTVSQALTQVFNGMINVVATQWAHQLLEAGMPAANPDFVLRPIALTVESVVPGGGSYFDFVAPGFIALNVMMSGLSALGAALAREQESGTLAGILMSPISRTSILFGKTISHALRNLIQGGLTLVIALVVFNITIRGNPLLIAAILILGTISFLGLGIVATSITREQESAQLVLGLLQFPMMFLSGVLFPIEQMPAILQTISKVLPLTYAVDALRKVMILGAGVEAILLPVGILLLLGGVTMTLGVPLFDRAVKR